MVLANCNRIAYKNKGLFTRKSEDALTWFHKIKSGEEITLPPKLAGLKICLFDLYKLIVGSGGHRMISREGKEGDRNELQVFQNAMISIQ